MKDFSVSCVWASFFDEILGENGSPCFFLDLKVYLEFSVCQLTMGLVSLTPPFVSFDPTLRVI